MPSCISILNAERALHGFQIANLQAGCKGLPATRALRLSAFFSRLLVEVDAHLRRSLKDVEELSKGQIQQRENHGHRVQLRKEDIVQTRA